jgi:branched-chain amino acid transport system substrate-binding protein
MGGFAMTDKRNSQLRVGGTGLTRRHVVGAAAGGALVVAAATPLRYGLAQSAPVQDRQPSAAVGGAAAIGKTALVGLQVAVERINKNGGILGREVKLIAEDDESKPDVGRRKTEKLLVDDQVDATVGGVLSNICLACMPLYDKHKIVNMISVCLDTTITTSKCSRYSFRPVRLRAGPGRSRSGPISPTSSARNGTSSMPTMPWGQSTKDAYAEEIKKAGGTVVGAPAFRSTPPT